MHWNTLKDVIPLNGQSCIVKRIRNKSAHYEICTFMHFGTEYIWITSKHNKVICDFNDKWYSIDSMMDNITQRLAFEIQSTLD